MRSVRTWAIVVGVASVLVLGAACALLARSYDAPFPGFLVYRSGAVTSLWRASWPGPQAGLHARDVVRTVDGKPVSSGPEFAAAILAARSRGSVTIEVQSPRSRLWPGGGGATHRVEVPLARMGSWDIAYTLVLPFSIGLLYLLLGALLYFLKPSLESSLTAALFLLAAAFYLTMFDAHTTWRFVRVWHLFPLFGPLSVHLFARFPEERRAWSRARVLVPLYAGAAAVIGWRQWTLDDPPANDVAALVTAILLSFEFTADLGLLAYTMVRGGSPAVRNRAKSMFVGLALTCGASVAWQFASRVGPPHLPMTADQAMLLSALFPALIAYAILKRNLFDVDAVLRASLSYFMATAFVLGVYFAVVAVAGDLVARLLGRSTSVAIGATLVAALLFHPVRVRAQRIVDRLWLRDRALLPELFELLRALSGVEGDSGVAERALGPLRRLANAGGAALLVRRPERFEVVGRDGALDESVMRGSVPAGGPLEVALRERPGPQAVRDLDEDAARECANLMKMNPEILLPIVSKSGLIGIVAFTARRRGLYGYGLRRALEQAAPQLALALENAALVQEGVMRERLAALGQLAAVIVHEVKNPLGIIKVSAGTLKKRAQDDGSAELAACIEDEVDRMDATVRRLLDLARPQAPLLRPCDVAGVIRQTLDRLGPDLSASGITVSTELPDSPRIAADGDELRRALLNLFLNARDAMPTGGTLTVRLRPADPELPDRRLEIEVEDTGIGMDDSVRRNLFRPFFTTRHGGTGLGLALVKRVVEDHKGAIRVESRPGEGSRFTLSIPG